MSNTEDEFDDDGNLIPKTDPNGPKALRDALKAAQKERDELRLENETFKKTQRQSTIKEVLAKAGASEKLHKLVAVEVDEPSEDAVLKWLEENGADYGWEADSDPANADTANAASRISAAMTNAAPPKDRVMTVDWIKNASVDELKQAGIL